jgi:hypothetical protein
VRHAVRIAFGDGCPPRTGPTPPGRKVASSAVSDSVVISDGNSRTYPDTYAGPAAAR